MIVFPLHPSVDCYSKYRTIGILISFSIIDRNFKCHRTRCMESNDVFQRRLSRNTRESTINQLRRKTCIKKNRKMDVLNILNYICMHIKSIAVNISIVSRCFSLHKVAKSAVYLVKCASGNTIWFCQRDGTLNTVEMSELNDFSSVFEPKVRANSIH